MSTYSDALLTAEQAMLFPSVCFRDSSSCAAFNNGSPGVGNCTSQFELNVDKWLGQKQEKKQVSHAADDMTALIRARAAAHLIAHEYIIHRDRHDRLLEESDRIHDACEDLEACIIAAEARVAKVRQTKYFQVEVSEADKGMPYARETVIPTCKHLHAFELHVRAQHLAGLTDTMSYLQAASYQSGSHGEEVKRTNELSELD